jgi:predicted enzyme related to lactoylglutathione lyase
MTNTKTTPTGAPIGWFEIGTSDPDGARRFYGDAFGWTFAVEGPYSIITTGAGHALQGGIQDTRRDLPEGTPATYAVPCVLVPDTAAMCDRIEALGGKVLVPATTVPTGLVYAHVADPDGNHIGLFTPPAG